MSIISWKPLSNAGLLTPDNAVVNNNIGINNTSNGSVISIQSNPATESYSFILPTTAGTSGQVLTSGGSGGVLTWSAGGGGGGGVSSVGITSSTNLITVSGSPVTSSGNIALTAALSSTVGTATAILTDAGPLIKTGGLYIGTDTVKITTNNSIKIYTQAEGLQGNGTISVINTGSVPANFLSCFAADIANGNSISTTMGKDKDQRGESVAFQYTWLFDDTLPIGEKSDKSTFGVVFPNRGQAFSVNAQLTTIFNGALCSVKTTEVINLDGSTISATMVGNLISVASSSVTSLVSDTATNICKKLSTGVGGSTIATIVGTTVETILYNNTATSITYSGGTGVTVVGATSSAAQTVYITFVVTGTNTLNMIIK